MPVSINNPGRLCIHLCSQTERSALIIADNVVTVFQTVLPTEKPFYVAWKEREGDLFSSYDYLAQLGHEQSWMNDSDLLVFMHDDARFLPATRSKLVQLWNATDEGGICGVAGATRIDSQGTWWSEGRPEGWSDPCRGRVLHPERGWLLWPVGNGPIFGRVLVCDGLMLAMRRGTLRKLEGFNSWGTPKPGLHFYDVDLCLRAHLNGGKNFVIDLPMSHESLGDYGKEWEKLRDVFVERWKGVLPVSI